MTLELKRPLLGEAACEAFRCGGGNLPPARLCPGFFVSPTGVPDGHARSLMATQGP